MAGWQHYAQPGQYANGQPVYAQQQPGYQQQAYQQPAYPQPQFQQAQQHQTAAAQYAAAYTPTYPQPQPDLHRPAHQSPAYPGSAHVSPSYPAAQPLPGSQAAAMPEFLSQLIGAGVIPAAAAAPPSAAASAAVASGTRPVAPTAFDPAQLKVRLAHAQLPHLTLISCYASVTDNGSQRSIFALLMAAQACDQFAKLAGTEPCWLQSSFHIDLAVLRLPMHLVWQWCFASICAVNHGSPRAFWDSLWQPSSPSTSAP